MGGIAVEERNSFEVDGIKIDLSIANRLLKRIIIREKQNIKTKQYAGSAMVKEIAKLIEEEVECY